MPKNGSDCTAIFCHRPHSTAIFQCQRSFAIPALFDFCLFVSMLIVLVPSRQKTVSIPVRAQFNSSFGHQLVPVPVLALVSCWHCRDGVHFHYGNMPSACTSIGTATMAFISIMGTCTYWHDPLPTRSMADICCRY